MNLNLLGIDFEEWYHPQLVKPFVNHMKHEPKIIKGIEKIIELLQKNETSATFFMVGEVLEHKPDILDLILENGHEIAFHTMTHSNLNESTKEKFLEELDTFTEMTNGKSKGFRAPSFSLNHNSSWLIDILEKNNYVYDSSVVPAKTKLYGLPNAENKPYRITKECLEKNSDDGKILEFPLLVTKFLGKKIPAGGGFYLRTLPLRIIKNSIKSYQKNNFPAVFYIHSWELTPEFMPKIKMSKQDEFVTYHNLNKAYGKMDELLKEFKFTSFDNFIQNSK